MNCAGKEVEFARYGDGTVAIILNEPSGERYCVATVCLSAYGAEPCPPDEVWLKLWGGQAHVAVALYRDRVVIPTGKEMTPRGAHPSCVAAQARLTPEAKAELIRQEERAR